MAGKQNKLRILSFVGRVVIVLPVFLCGCNSEKDSTKSTDSTDREAEAYYKQGKSHSEAGRYKEAIIAYKKAIDLRPDYAEASYFIGEAYDRLRQYKAALAAYKKYDTFEPTGEMADKARKAISDIKDAEPHFRQGVRHYLKGRRMLANIAFSKAIAIKPDHASAYSFLGDTCLGAGDFQHARYNYEQCIAINPYDNGAYLQIGKAYAALHQYPKAIAAFQKAIDLEPTGEKADLARKLISMSKNRDRMSKNRD